jgi:hypothetical protein
MSTSVTRAIKLIGQTVLVPGVLMLIAGLVWLRNLAFSVWSYKGSAIAFGIGAVIAALGAGLLKVARSRESTGENSSTDPV